MTLLSATGAWANRNYRKDDARKLEDLRFLARGCELGAFEGLYPDSSSKTPEAQLQFICDWVPQTPEGARVVARPVLAATHDSDLLSTLTFQGQVLSEYLKQNAGA